MPILTILGSGRVTTKRPQLEKKDFLKRRLDEASKLIDTYYLALSPQCGFASVVKGNLITEADQRAKLASLSDCFQLRSDGLRAADLSDARTWRGLPDGGC